MNYIKHLVSSMMAHVRGRTAPSDEDVSRIARQALQPLQSVNPETNVQWTRLQRTVGEAEDRAATAPGRYVPRLQWALALGVIILVGLYLYSTLSLPSATTYLTARGEQKEITLTDGSLVTLNYGTELVVPRLQTGAPRRVALEGEAYFRVQHTGVPFVVSTQFATVEVVGTEFDLRTRDKELELAVITGSVRVRAVRNGRDSLLVLDRGQRALCPSDAFPRRIADVPSPEYPGWLHGKLFLDGTSLTAACREIEMRFGVRIDMKTPAETGRVTGILNAGTAKTAVAALCELTGRNYGYDGEKFTLY